MNKSVKSAARLLSLAIVFCLAISAVFAPDKKEDVAAVGEAISSYVTKVLAPIENDFEKYFDANVVSRLPETVADDDEISVIVKMSVNSIMDEYELTDKSTSLSEYATSDAAAAVVNNINKESDALIAKLDKSGVSYVLGESYDTLLGGFEVTVKAFDFEKLNKVLSSDATLIVGEEYMKCETEVVTNFVEVYETGIFDSSDSVYQGDGVVVAVLDTGLDYTHTAFSVENFTTDKEQFTLANVSEMVEGTAAARFTHGLTGEDVYVSSKVPYAYDYADKDPDVLPINSEHGTHVAGIIAGKDDTITGVAPNAQLAIFKVFSDISDGAKSSWLIAALEDCVVLGVDVINMSLGSSCGFTREVDEVAIAEIYDRVGDAGISLITACSNDYTATFSSKKNGTNSLTSNPDYGTVGAPSTYQSALSVASVNGVKTPYLMYGDQIIYFNEASTSNAKTKNFVDDLLNTLYDGGFITNPDYAEVEYVLVAGIGRASDYYYGPDYYKGKIALVKRGQTTFEEKIRIALKEKGAAGVIIYNNISGTISMAVGADIGAACSISQDDGEMLAAPETGKLIVSRANTAGPFMSDFSSWGPTSDLKIKPEITAHGGEILSAVPGQNYDRLSGTSMACPNQAGAAALIRQYVKSGKFGENITPLEVTAIVNKLMMSTADIVMNKNGLPYAVRKQGAGLINIKHSYQTAAYITAYDKDTGKPLDKSKLELGDDKQRTGEYVLNFDVTNVSGGAASYDVGSIVMTEGVSKTYTGHSDTTVSGDGYLLSGAKSTVTAVVGGTQNGDTITVPANSTAKVTMKITLSDKDKEYIDASFKYGMYVEGFVTFAAKSGTTVNMNVPFLAYYGDWTQAPIFDEEYYDTNVDELNKGLDDDDKLTEDAYPTRVIGGIYSDYISTLGSYYFVQDPSATQIAANKEHIALSNQSTGESGSAIHTIRDIWAGLLRNVKEYDITIADDSTGEVVYQTTGYNQRKSWSRGGAVRPSTIDLEFDAMEHDLKNNTRYTVTVTTYIDYGTRAEQKNVRNVFTFPLYVDFQAPIVTDVQYRTEYDRTTKKTSLYADISVYDNHYAMALQVGQITRAEEGSEYTFTLNGFGKYITPVYSSYNSTAVVTVDLTEYVDLMKNSIGAKYDDNGSFSVVENTDSFIITCYDYAMNRATYEVRLPDEILSLYFNQEEVRLSPNETLEMSNVLNVYPADSWLATLEYESSDPSVADVVNSTILAKTSGTATLTAVGYDRKGNRVTASVEIKVLGPGDAGYNGTYSVPEVSKFVLTGYETIKAFYKVDNEDRDIGVTGGSYEFGKEFLLKMYPSEKVRLQYSLDTYYPERTKIEYRVGNSRVAVVDQDGVIRAVSEGSTIVSARVLFDGKSVFSRSVSVTVKDPIVNQSIYLMSYYGDGDENHVVDLPADRGITTIYSFAFSGYEYVEKDLEHGDVIDKEDPYFIKQWYIGEDTIKKVIIPEGVTDIMSYAFAYLTALEEVVLPKSLIRIGMGAFEGCAKLKKINLENVKFVNQRSFYNCGLEQLDLSSVVSIGNYTFSGNKISYVELPRSSQSLGEGAFADNAYLTNVEFNAPKIKIGPNVFKNCAALSSVGINAAVISASAFQGCSALTDVTLGKDVSVIGEYAFAGTNVSAFKLSASNTTLTLKANGALVYKGGELLLAAPQYAGAANTITLADATSIGSGAFSGNVKVRRIVANDVKSVGSYAFAGCTNLTAVSMDKIENIGDYAFTNTGLTSTPDLSNAKEIGAYAFYLAQSLTTVSVPDNCNVSKYAFAYCPAVTAVTLGDGAVIGEYAFYCPINIASYENTSSTQYYTQYAYEVKNEDGTTAETLTYLKYNYGLGVFSRMTALTIGGDVELGDYCFYGNGKLATVTLGDGAVIGDYAFFNCGALTSIDLSKAVWIGDYAFSGTKTRQFERKNSMLDYAYDVYYNNGTKVNDGWMFACFAPALTSVDLSSVEHLGEGAFSFNEALTTVTLSSGMSAIPAHAFEGTSVKSVVLPESVTDIGDNAFDNSLMETIDLTNVISVGDRAFTNARLYSVTFGDEAIVGIHAFLNNVALATVNNLENVIFIGEYAFGKTALTSANLEKAEHIGSYAFFDAPITSVTLGDQLVTLGDNPFAYCPIETFGKQEEVTFNGQYVGETINESYDVSEKVFVRDGVLYATAPNGGLLLVSYPTQKNTVEYAVEEDTVRVTAYAFAGSKVQTVTLPVSLKAIGDKAFYGCGDLNTMVFKSYNAPLLEESFSKDYATFENMSYTGNIVLNNGTVIKGLGIVKYYMWNYTALDCCYFFGANFVNYIGHIDDKITMVKPVNGENYNTFVMDQYFATEIEGAASPLDATLEVIELINRIPANVTLAAKQNVVAARTAYDALPSTQQKALVENYGDLLEAEQTIEYLESRDKQSSSDSGQGGTSEQSGSADSGDSVTSEQQPSGSQGATDDGNGCNGGCNGGCDSAIGVGGAVISTIAIALAALVVARKKKED